MGEVPSAILKPPAVDGREALETCIMHIPLSKAGLPNLWTACSPLGVKLRPTASHPGGRRALGLPLIQLCLPEMLATLSSSVLF